jgi:hypothetical protein
MAVLTATLPGIPLLYSGQESFSRKRLAFFEKDPIDWGSRSQAEFYTRLLKWRSTHAALQAPLAFDGLEWVPDANVNVVTFKRRGPRGGSGARLQISVNLTNQPQKALGRINLPAWGWQIGAPTAPAKQNAPVRSRSGNAKPAAKSGAKPSSNSSSKSTPKKTSQSPQSESKAAPGR